MGIKQLVGSILGGESAEDTKTRKQSLQFRSIALVGEARRLVDEMAKKARRAEQITTTDQATLDAKIRDINDVSRQIAEMEAK